jgi:hypothetical protein
VPRDDLPLTFAEARRFHDQPMDDKLAVRMNEHNNGYMTLGRYAVWTSDVNANDPSTSCGTTSGIPAPPLSRVST